MAKWQRVKIPVPENFTPSMREEFGQQIVEFIRQRTENDNKGLPYGQSGIYKGSYKQFPKYSQVYKKSVEFKIAGKSSDVDLTLSGDMLAAFDVIGHKKGEITIGFESGTLENDKADGNINGSYGTSGPNPKKARNFLGLTESDYSKLLKKYSEDL